MLHEMSRFSYFQNAAVIPMATIHRMQEHAGAGFVSTAPGRDLPVH